MDSAFVPAKKYLEVPTWTVSARAVFPSSDENEAIIELAGLNEDLVTKHEIPESDHQRLRRLLKHLDDDAIVGPNSSTLATSGTGQTAASR
ncbi:MAG: hypothetical protein AUH43_15555 [Acidobacteria bacterium 13_1_40CM_65_14]|jgi:hypothetical protein|nr:MAG: hypothetical protein AUH43_15555 [Acidobacteria bacterium 13_1_40CM_65_14]OLE81954.1 MAG: hypothetical protein AUF76_11585 [Acidobacteria bacterium 13_1_20CM_2_65_9]